MANHTTKKLPGSDGDQAIRRSYNEVDATMSVNGFLVGNVGHKIVLTVSTTTITNDTETYAFSDNGTPLYSLQIIYTDGTRAQMISATRIS
jgi:hypothetical protein